MRGMVPIVVSVLWCGLYVLPAPVQAQTAPPQERAEALHQLALKSAERLEYDDAIRLWTEAEHLAPNAKYSFNLAMVHANRRAWVPAWEAAQRTLAHGIDDSRRTPVDKLIARAEKKLLRKHALIRLTVQTPKATVLRNGTVWPAPRVLWTPDGASQLEISANGFETLQRDWTHPAGGRAELSLALTPATAPPPPPVKTPAPVESSPSHLWKWVTVGTGVVLVGAGVGMLSHAHGLADDIETLNETTPLPANYGEEYDNLYSDYDTAEKTYIALLVTGGVITAAGIAWWVWDMVSSPHTVATDKERTLLIAPVLNGKTVGVIGTLRF